MVDQIRARVIVGWDRWEADIEREREKRDVRASVSHVSCIEYRGCYPY